MLTIHRTVYYPSRNSLIRLYYLTDLHIGARGCDETLLRAHVAAIASDPDAYWIGGGDYIDGITHTGDKRYDPEVLAEWCLGEKDVLGCQAAYAVDLLKPIAARCLGMGSGNHEDMTDSQGRVVYREIVAGVARAGGQSASDLAYGIGGFVILNTRRGNPDSHGNVWSMRIYCHHGTGGGALAGGHALRIERMLGSYDCDLSLSGHVHRPVTASRTILMPGAHRKQAQERTAWAAIIPGYLSGSVQTRKDGWPVNTYSERKQLPPQPLGTLPIIIRPGEKDKRYRIEIHNGARPVMVEPDQRIAAPIPVDFTEYADERKTA